MPPVFPHFHFTQKETNGRRTVPLCGGLLQLGNCQHRVAARVLRRLANHVPERGQVTRIAGFPHYPGSSGTKFLLPMTRKVLNCANRPWISQPVESKQSVPDYAVVLIGNRAPHHPP